MAAKSVLEIMAGTRQRRESQIMRLHRTRKTQMHVARIDAILWMIVVDMVMIIENGDTMMNHRNRMMIANEVDLVNGGVFAGTMKVKDDLKYILRNVVCRKRILYAR
jgi:hypothetical protein